MTDTIESLDAFLDLEGLEAACHFDERHGTTAVCAEDVALDVSAAAPGHAEALASVRDTLCALGLGDFPEDIVITVGKRYHVLWPIGSDGSRFVHLVLDRATGNLALVRRALIQAQSEMETRE